MFGRLTQWSLYILAQQYRVEVLGLATEEGNYNGVLSRWRREKRDDLG